MNDEHFALNNGLFLPQTQTRKKKIECKPELIIASIQRFYTSNPDISKIMPYLIGESNLSLRIIDWFVTKYSRKNFIRYDVNGQNFLVYLSYKGQLKAYSKQYFDPNCRRERIMFKIAGYEPFLTTIGKLNFFRWAFEMKILDYIEKHEEEIRTGYNSFLKENIQHQQNSKYSSETASSTTSSASNASAASTISAINSVESAMTSISTLSNSSVRQTRRKRSKQTPSALRKLQVVNNPVEIEFK
jgi:hypothetical protein